jgi:hypothetical protein
MAQGGKRVLAAGRETDSISLSLQPFGDCFGEFSFVFDQQNVQKPWTSRTLFKNVQARLPGYDAAAKMSGKCKKNVRFA